MEQVRDAVSSSDAGADALPVLPDAAGDVVGDANVKRPVLAAGKDVNIVGHRHAPTPMGPGDKPRDDNDMYNPCEIVAGEGVCIWEPDRAPPITYRGGRLAGMAI